jgi:hypothetical protein
MIDYYYMYINLSAKVGREKITDVQKRIFFVQKRKNFIVVTSLPVAEDLLAVVA